MTEKYGHVAKLDGGIMGVSLPDALYISDPLALHAILVRDENLFRESTEFAGLFGIVHHGDGVASVYGTEHKRQRKLMDQAFTPSRVAKLTPLFHTISRQLQTSLETEILERPGQSIDILDHFTRTALELISQGGLGHTFNSFDRDSKEFVRFYWALTSVLPLASGLFLVLPYLDAWRKIRPEWVRKLLAGLVSYLPWACARHFKTAVDAMHPIYAELVENKKAVFARGGAEALEQTATGGKDLLTILLKSNWAAREEDKLADDSILANISSIVHGGQETTSGSLARFISVMAADPSLQTRLRDEIRQAKQNKGGDDLNFTELNGLSILDAVCREVFRIYSPVTFVWRQTIEDTTIPLQFPVRDPHSGTETRDLFIAKGTPVYLGLSAANRSTAIWGPDASEFKPERWLGKDASPGNPDKIKLPGIYSNMMTFLGGGRSCPGYRFAMLEIKLILASLLLSFSFEQASEIIDWKLGITITPYVRGREDEGAKVPVLVHLL
ncbi:cytochrome P450 [Infundibulicybe gibba]|nr:cytochrome P450 [Infundibulicybe gibba]